jgi:hypothetical protein
MTLEGGSLGEVAGTLEDKPLAICRADRTGRIQDLLDFQPGLIGEPVRKTTFRPKSDDLDYGRSAFCATAAALLAFPRDDPAAGR